MSYEQYLEDQDYELNARYDYIQEAYGSTAIGLDDGDEYYQEDQTPQGLRQNLNWFAFAHCDCAVETDEIPF